MREWMFFVSCIFAIAIIVYNVTVVVINLLRSPLPFLPWFSPIQCTKQIFYATCLVIYQVWHHSHTRMQILLMTTMEKDILL